VDVTGSGLSIGGDRRIGCTSGCATLLAPARTRFSGRDRQVAFDNVDLVTYRMKGVVQVAHAIVLDFLESIVTFAKVRFPKSFSNREGILALQSAVSVLSRCVTSGLSVQSCGQCRFMWLMRALTEMPSEHLFGARYRKAFGCDCVDGTMRKRGFSVDIAICDTQLVFV
jgi:hypothetical protein